MIKGVKLNSLFAGPLGALVAARSKCTLTQGDPQFSAPSVITESKWLRLRRFFDGFSVPPRNMRFFSVQYQRIYGALMSYEMELQTSLRDLTLDSGNQTSAEGEHAPRTSTPATPSENGNC